MPPPLLVGCFIISNAHYIKISCKSFFVLFQDDVPISLVANERADDTHYILRDGDHTLKIVEARTDDSGLYTCVATNIAG